LEEADVSELYGDGMAFPASCAHHHHHHHPHHHHHHHHQALGHGCLVGGMPPGAEVTAESLSALQGPRFSFACIPAADAVLRHPTCYEAVDGGTSDAASTQGPPPAPCLIAEGASLSATPSRRTFRTCCHLMSPAVSASTPSVAPRGPLPPPTGAPRAAMGWGRADRRPSVQEGSSDNAHTHRIPFTHTVTGDAPRARTWAGFTWPGA